MAAYLAEQIAEMGPFDIRLRRQRWHSRRLLEVEGRRAARFTLYDLADRLRVRGWQVPAYSLPPNCETTAFSGLWCGTASAAVWRGLLADIERSVAYFEKHPMSDDVAGTPRGFRHM